MNKSTKDVERGGCGGGVGGATPAARRRATQIGIPAPGGRLDSGALGLVETRTGYYTRGVRARGADAVRVERLGRAGK